MTDDLDIDAIEDQNEAGGYHDQHEIRALVDEVKRLRAEVAARPAITPEDAAQVWSVSPRSFRIDGMEAAARVWEALREHGAGRKP